MKVFWDTNLFIYMFEEHGNLTDLTAALHQRMRLRNDELLTSVMTLGEILVGPLLAGDDTGPLEQQISSAATLIPFDLRAARRFAAIRVDRSVRPPDAIQLACAAAGAADLFVTNDARLSRRIVPGVPIITSLAGVPI